MVILKKSLIVFVLLILVITNILIFIKPNETKEIMIEQVAKTETVERTNQEITSRSLDITRHEEVNTTEETEDVETEKEIEVPEIQVEPEVESTYFPTVSHTISSQYGYRSRGDFHTGIDLCGQYGDNIYAYKSGTVIKTQYSNVSYGNIILIQHDDGTQTRYAHLSKINVSLNESVKGGQIIGHMGSTGNSTGNHLHFEVIANGSAVNPYSYIF